ncbi:MAG: hypothetical protein ACFFB5_20690 [Promethearchaeota archaeon]
MCFYRARSGWDNALVHGHPFIAEISEVTISMGTKRKTSMTKASARRIQIAADRSGKNQGFKARAMRAAAKKRK